MFLIIGPEMVEALLRRPNESIEKMPPPAKAQSSRVAANRAGLRGLVYFWNKCWSKVSFIQQSSSRKGSERHASNRISTWTFRKRDRAIHSSGPIATAKHRAAATRDRT